MTNILDQVVKKWKVWVWWRLKLTIENVRLLSSKESVFQVLIIFSSVRFLWKSNHIITRIKIRKEIVRFWKIKYSENQVLNLIRKINFNFSSITLKILAVRKLYCMELQLIQLKLNRLKRKKLWLNLKRVWMEY